MRVKALMISAPITIGDDASIQEAIEVMKTNAIRHLPVIAKDKTLKGLVTLANLREGLLPSMLGDISLSDLIVTNPISVSPEDPIEVAARRIYNHKISGMPVLSDNKVVGIITETDILRTFIDMMGILTASTQLEVVVGDDPEKFKKALHIIQDNGGDIINISMTAHQEQEEQRVYCFRLTQCEIKNIVNALKAAGFDLVDILD